ncbi:hypothetical protein FA95DRAFT_928001 [Auriscalpium vulgare]|uniref:Uncharacterized protein n=1 Tax=Auriscalpium vulgare TaxID=40419 RepID=A0ACB8R7I1_9AGAM|nr:hypothetical protein FA95DRAFT_928001 [Auriscalpium vulgare]
MVSTVCEKFTAATSSSIWISTSSRQRSRSQLIANTCARQRNRAPTPILSRLLGPLTSSSTFAGAMFLDGSICTPIAGQSSTHNTSFSPASAVDPVESAGLHSAMSPASHCTQTIWRGCRNSSRPLGLFIPASLFIRRAWKGGVVPRVGLSHLS